MLASAPSGRQGLGIEFQLLEGINRTEAALDVFLRLQVLEGDLGFCRRRLLCFHGYPMGDDCEMVARRSG